MGGAVAEASFERSLAAGVDVAGGEQLFGRTGQADGFVDGALGGGAAVEDAAFVEMDMGLDQAGGDEAALGVGLRRVAYQMRLDGDDAAAGDADVAEALFQAGAADDVIDHIQVGSIGEGGVPPASIAAPASSSRSSR